MSEKFRNRPVFNLILLGGCALLGRGIALFIEPVIGRLSALIFLVTWLFGIAIIWLLWSEKSNLTHYFGRFKLRYMLLGSLWGIVLFVIGALGYFLAQEVLKIPQPPDVQIFQTQGEFWITMLTALVVVGGAVAEELIFRGLILNKLHGITSARLSVLASAALFSVYHMSLFQLLPTLLWGIGFGILAIRTKSLWLSTIAHAFVNLAGLLFFIFGGPPK